ncbi:SusC/RagA family TonB-linked outer membrane protein [Chitinophaga lutea]
MNTFTKSLLTLLAFALIAGGAAAQQKMVTIRGVVQEKGSNQPLPGIAIWSGNPPKGIAVTGSDGSFSVTVPEGAELSFRSISYEQFKVKAKEGASLRVMLSVKESKLDEAVIIGYQKKKRETTTGSTTVISGKELQDVPVANVMELLQGRVAGLNVQNNTGAPGYAGTIQMRGLSTLTITGSGDDAFLSPTSPLYIVDGVQVDPNSSFEYGFQSSGPGLSPISLIPQEDIESIQFLKDAQATAQYGSRGAYGVIIITTKRGKSSVPIVAYTGNFFMNIPPSLRQVVGGHGERETRILQAMLNTDAPYKTAGDVNATPFLADSLNPYYNQSTDWQGLFYTYTYNQTHNMTVSGGDTKFNYKANLGYYNEKGIIKNTGFNRYSLGTNFQYMPSTKLRVFANITTSLGVNSKGSGNGLQQTDAADAGNNSSLLPPPSFYSSTASAVAALRTNNINKTARVATSLEVDYELLPGLHAISTMSFENTTATENNFRPAAINGNFSEVYAYNDRNNKVYNRNSISYFKSWGDQVHNLTASVFNELARTTYQANIQRLKRTPGDNYYGPIGSDPYYNRGGVLPNARDLREMSVASAVSYDYKKKYVVELSFRRDATSQAGSNTPFSNNPSVGLRWNFYKENALVDANWLEYGSLRGSWGRNMVPQGSIFDAYGIYDDRNGKRYNEEPQSGIVYDDLPNANLKPKSSTQYNVGLDLGLWQGKLQVELDGYVKYVDNTLFEVELPSINGFKRMKSDDAGIMNMGFEWMVTYRPLPKTSKTTWTITLTGALNRDYLTRLPYGKREYLRPDPSTGQLILFRVGRNAFTNVLLNSRGAYPSDDYVAVDPATGKPVVVQHDKGFAYFQHGDIRWTDVNGDYIINRNDYIYAGSSQPLINGGLNNFVQHRNFSLSVNMSYTAIRSILNNAVAKRFQNFSQPLNNSSLVPIEEYNYWKQVGNNAKYPNPYDYRRYPLVQPFRYDQTLFEEDGSYLKVNNITVSYNFDRQLLKRAKMTSARLYVTMGNAFIFQRYTGPNAENVTALGRDDSKGYPMRRSLTLGVNAQF